VVTTALLALPAFLWVYSSNPVVFDDPVDRFEVSERVSVFAGLIEGAFAPDPPIRVVRQGRSYRTILKDKLLLT